MSREDGSNVRTLILQHFEILRCARMAAMRKLRCGGGRHDEWLSGP